MKHYEVYSPEFMMYGGSYDPPEPPEYGACFSYVKAETPARAKAAALRLDEFEPWRDGTDNPFTGLKVKLSRCEHGVCYCDDCAKVATCAACDRAFDDELREIELADATTSQAMAAP